nr:MAG TPA: hypothetical protein [Caudoviricetes sp.]
MVMQYLCIICTRLQFDLSIDKELNKGGESEGGEKI